MFLRNWVPLVVFFAIPLFATSPSLQPADLCECTVSVIADFNGDGLDDLLDASGLRLNLDGRFAEAVSVSGIGGGEVLKLAGDYNGDGFADVIVRNVSPSHSPGPDRLLLGNGSGGFRPGAPLPVEAGGAAGRDAVDYDADGRLDLVLMKKLSVDPVAGITNTLSFYRGNGDGTFSPDQTVVWPYEIFPSMAFADFNRDGRRDAVLSPNNRPYLHFFLADASGRWSEPRVRFVAVHPRLAPALDLNGDGNADLALFDWHDLKTGLTVLFGDGTGHFPATARLADVAYRDTPVAGDLHEGGGDELAFIDGNGVEIVSGVGNELRLVSAAASGMANTMIRGGRFRSGGGLDLLAVGELGYRRPASRLLFAEGSLAVARPASRRTRTVSRARTATLLQETTYAGRALGSCPPFGLDVWSFTREGIFVDLKTVQGEAAMVDGQMVVRVMLHDEARALTGNLTVTPELLAGDLVDVEKNACGTQGRLSLKAKRVE